MAISPADVLIAKLKEHYAKRWEIQISFQKEGKGVRAYITFPAEKYRYTCPISGPQYDEKDFQQDCYLPAPKTSYVNSMAFKEAFANAEYQINDLVETLQIQAERWKDGEEIDYDLERKG